MPSWLPPAVIGGHRVAVDALPGLTCRHIAEALRGDSITLRRYRPSDADALKESIAISFEHLHGWMAFAGAPPTEESVLAFLAPAVESFGGSASDP